jgi:hypothetical protein
MMGSIRLWSAGFAALMVLVTGACSKKAGDAESGDTATASESSESSSGMDPCALLEVAEVESVMGKLAGPALSAGPGWT